MGGRTFEQACDLLENDMPYELTVKTIDGTPVVVFKTADFDYRLSGKDDLQKI